jgi:uncharacterized protein YndB with AHSA1/START domain
MSVSGDGASVSVLVKVPPAPAFDLFTREIDLWWKRGPQFRIGTKEPGQLSFEPGVGGRLLETYELPAGPRTFEHGRIKRWDPPTLLEFAWRGINFAAGELTSVQVRFEPTRSGTLVTVRHSGFAALRAGHPVRHGLDVVEFSRMIGLWWGELMAALREHAVR